MTAAERRLLRRLQGDHRDAFRFLFLISARAAAALERVADPRARAALVAIERTADKGQERLTRRAR